MFKKILFFIPFLVCFYFLTACQNNETEPQGIEKLEFDNKSEAEVAFQNSTVECEDKSECPGFIAAIVQASEERNHSYFRGDYQSYNIGLCSGQLISKNKILTNRHCVPAAIADAGADCSQNMMFLFPETGQYSSERVGCRKIISISRQYGNEHRVRPDWAVIELEREIDRSLPNIDISGLETNTDFYLYPNYFQASSISIDDRDYQIARSIIKKVNCRSRINHLYFLGYFNPFSDIVGGTCDFEIIRGNSGSGIYKEDHQLSGVISYAQRSRESRVSYLNDSVVVRNQWAGGTNLSCVDYFNAERSSFCDFERRDVFSTQLLSSIIPFLYAAQDSENLNIQVQERIAEQPIALWEPTDSENFVLNYANEERMDVLSEIPEEIQSLILPYMYVLEHESVRQAYPFFPRCIRGDDSRESSFELRIPVVSAEVSDVNLQTDGSLSLPTSYSEIIFDFQFNQEEGIYLGQLRRLPEDVRTRYEELRTNLDDGFYNCRAEGLRESRINAACFSAQMARIAYDLFLRRHSDMTSLFEAESTLSTYSRLETISLPACNTLSTDDVH